MTNWIVLDGAVMTPDGTSVSREARMKTHEMGDGYTARIPDGINNTPAVFTVAYKYLTQPQHAALIAFVNTHKKAGTALTIPILPEDSSGALTGLFYIQSSSFSAVEGGGLYNHTIVCRQVYAA